jgi:nucleoside-diphosphate-sugar epimerase
VHVVGAERDFVRVNIDGTRTVVDAAGREVSVDRFVHVSTPSVAHSGSALVGAGAGAADPLRAQGSYARTKAVAELIAIGANRDDLSVVAIRPHLVWGPGDTQLIGRIVERARSGRLPLVGSGAALIDTTYVDNAVDAIVHALDRAPQVAGEALVVSNGEPRTVAELFGDICRAAGVAPPVRHVPLAVAWTAGAVAEGVWTILRRSDDPPMTRFLATQLATAHWFDQRRTRELLAWSPRISLDEGLRRLAASYA